MGKSRLRASSPVCLSPSPRELSPPSSVIEDWDVETAMDTSRPTSLAIPRTGSPFANTPSLADILSNTAPPPWTLSAFMAFLSQNHCLETLEFILDAERYRTVYFQIAEGDVPDGPEHACSLWLKVIEAYIMPCAPREVNLPAHVRDRLLRLPCMASKPPHPFELDEAVQIVRELMNDSVLVPFLESLAPTTTEHPDDGDAQESRPGRPRLRIPRDGVSGDETSQSPRTPYLPLFSIGRSGGASHRSISSSTEAGDGDLVTDDSSSRNSTPGIEPVTPPTTPPTSDFAFATSPNTLQRAISGNSWKKMGAKLGLSRKTKSTRPTTYEATDAPKRSWEDPHPGERLPIGPHAGLHNHPQTISGDAMDGMAVKARSAYQDNGPWMVRRSVRIRHRNVVPKPLKIPAEVPEEPDAKSAPLISTRRCDSTTPASSFLLLPPPEPLRSLEIDTDTETEAGTEAGNFCYEKDISRVDTAAVSQTDLSDFSSYLGISPRGEDDDSSVTVVDSEAFTRTSSVEDLYGWEAELDRKMKCDTGNTACSMCPCRYQCRGADNGKRSLLHRVFSGPGRRLSTGL
ncbi:hypothetical protein F4779DRAFT_627051 [Xylariaceae sp. FL0662B]|nr:hypothetical protein F4779DRAFT_627051 [Xylariaceae sp. FL0662B]